MKSLSAKFQVVLLSLYAMHPIQHNSCKIKKETKMNMFKSKSVLIIYLTIKCKINITKYIRD